MIRALLLSLTLLLITLASAQLAHRQNLAEVKNNAEVPKPSISAQEESQPPAATPAPTAPPRFVEEIELPAEPKATVIPQVTASPSEGAVKPSIDASHGATPLDPSAEQQAGGEQSQPAVPPSPNVPSQEELKKIAAPFVKEIYAIKDNAFDQMALIEQKATTDYLSTPVAQRQQKLSEMAGVYLPQVTMLIQVTDEKVNSAILRMIAALAAVGGDDALAADARAAYEQEKTEKISHYMKMIERLSETQTTPAVSDEGSGL